jgi:hypothetical protein
VPWRCISGVLELVFQASFASFVVKNSNMQKAIIPKRTSLRAIVACEHQIPNKIRLFFTVVPCILILSKYHYQVMHKRIALKGVLKFTLNSSKMFRCNHHHHKGAHYMIWLKISMLKYSIKIQCCG